jgi:flagellar hook-basal body complex protein FliE
MEKNIQIVKMDKSILEYFRMVMDFDNQSKEYREVTEKEFTNQLTKSLNCSVNSGKKEIKWV